MKIKVTSDKSYYFSDNIELSERLEEVNKMLEDVLIFDGIEMTVEEYFRHTWNKVESNGINLSMNNMSRIAFYLSKLPEQQGRHDKEILTRNDELEMDKGVRRVTRNKKNFYVPSRYVLHTDISKEKAVQLGLIDSSDDFNS